MSYTAVSPVLRNNWHSTLNYISVRHHLMRPSRGEQRALVVLKATLSFFSECGEAKRVCLSFEFVWAHKSFFFGTVCWFLQPALVGVGGLDWLIDKAPNSGSRFDLEWLRPRQ